MAENNCLNDSQNIALIDRIIVDLTTILGSIVGFERKFGSLKKAEIKSIDTLGSELQDAIDAYTAKHADDVPVPLSNILTDYGVDLDGFAPTMNLW